MAYAALLSFIVLLLVDPSFGLAQKSCEASAVTGLAALAAAPGYDKSSASTSSWGPPTTTFPAVSITAGAPAGCDAAAWSRARLVGAASKLMAKGFCYCHHHAPWWLPPKGPARGAECAGACAVKGTKRKRPYQGVDCSNYSAYLYNMAFGLRLTSAIASQACEPGKAPGRLLPVTAKQPELFKPGDLLYITYGSNASTPLPIPVSHVVVWTGLTVDTQSKTSRLSLDRLVSDVKPGQREGVRRYARERAAAGKPVYVISDSTFTGPNLRPFAGWYVKSFSHARRIIDPDPSLPDNADAVAKWDGSECQSYHALLA